MEHYPLVRTIYLYLFTIVGLTLLVIGGVRFVDMGLKMFVFTKADSNQESYGRVVSLPYPMEKLDIAKDDGEFTEEERESIRGWLEDYEEYKEIDQVSVSRHRDASLNLAMILIGLPLYLYHWRIIRKETKG